MTTPCEASPEIWFSDRADDIAEAKAACGHCPALNACLELVARIELAHGPQFGVWAARTPSERSPGKTCRIEGCGQVAVVLSARAGEAAYCSPEHSAEGRRIKKAEADAKRGKTRTWTKRTITCAGCGRERKLYARGMCSQCERIAKRRSAA